MDKASRRASWIFTEKTVVLNCSANKSFDDWRLTINDRCSPFQEMYIQLPIPDSSFCTDVVHLNGGRVLCVATVSPVSIFFVSMDEDSSNLQSKAEKFDLGSFFPSSSSSRSGNFKPRIHLHGINEQSLLMHEEVGRLIVSIVKKNIFCGFYRRILC